MCVKQFVVITILQQLVYTSLYNKFLTKQTSKTTWKCMQKLTVKIIVTSYLYNVFPLLCILQDRL